VAGRHGDFCLHQSSLVDLDFRPGHGLGSSISTFITILFAVGAGRGRAFGLELPPARSGRAHPSRVRRSASSVAGTLAISIVVPGREKGGTTQWVPLSGRGRAYYAAAVTEREIALVAWLHRTGRSHVRPSH